MPYSSSSLIVCLEVSHAGAVHPFGFLPRNLVRTSIDFERMSRCCCSFIVETNSCVYPWSPLYCQISIVFWDKNISSKFAHISCPASRTLVICSGNDSRECAGTNQVVLIPYLSHSFRRRSIPTVAPKIPRETSVGFAGDPFLVLILSSISTMPLVILSERITSHLQRRHRHRIQQVRV